MLPQTPTRLGRYEIVDEIGKGAMGVVYLARDPLIGRLVALKTFRIGYSVKDQEMEQFRLRFMREAQSAGILTHPNIVTIHDVVESSEDGVAFIAMEYVRGTNLKLLLQNDQALSMQFVIDTIAQIGDALDYAHSNRVIHRDVKPANILITSENRVKITDFGIARLDSSNLTQEGQLLGTPNYMAPEQIQGKEVDHRADLFSLGVVLYEMLTRHKPFQGENLTVVSHRIVYDHFTPPRDYVQGLPSGLDKVLSRALEKDPGRRYQRAREMADDLRRTVGLNTVQDELNETQSLSSTMVLPPSLAQVPPLPPPAAPASQPAAKPSLFSRWRKPAVPVPVAAPPLPDPGTGTGIGTGTGTGTGTGSLPPVPALAAVPPFPELPQLPPELTPEEDTVATNPAGMAAPAPPPSRPGLSLRWLLVGVGTAALVVALGWGAMLLLQSWSKPAPVPPPIVAVTPGATPEERQAQVAKLIADGNAAMRRGDWGVAIASYQQAEQIDPNGEARQFREAAEKQAQEYQSLKTKEQTITSLLKSGREAVKGKRYSQAIVLANQALSLDPQNPDAKRLLADARRRANQRTPAAEPQTPGPGEEIAGTIPIPSEAQPVAEPSPVEARSASVRVHFQSEVDASLSVRVDGKVVVSQNFARGGLFGRKKNGDGYEFTDTIDVPAGAKIRLYVTPKRKVAIVRSFEAKGGPQRLEAYLSKDEHLTAQLN